MAFLVACELTNDEACDDAEGFGAGGLNIFFVGIIFGCEKIPLFFFVDVFSVNMTKILKARLVFLHS